MATASCLPSSPAVSPLEVGRRIVPTHFDAFRLHVSASYREVFDRAVQKVLAQQGWQIVKVRTRAQKRSPAAISRSPRDPSQHGDDGSPPPVSKAGLRPRGERAGGWNATGSDGRPHSATPPSAG